MVTGKGSVLRLGLEQVAWLRHKLDVLLARAVSGYPLTDEPEVEEPVAVDPSWLTSAQAAARVMLSYQVFLRRARVRGVRPVHRAGSVLVLGRGAASAFGCGRREQRRVGGRTVGDGPRDPGGTGERFAARAEDLQLWSSDRRARAGPHWTHGRWRGWDSSALQLSHV